MCEQELDERHWDYESPLAKLVKGLQLDPPSSPQAGLSARLSALQQQALRAEDPWSKLQAVYDSLRTLRTADNRAGSLTVIASRCAGCLYALHHLSPARCESL